MKSEIQLFIIWSKAREKEEKIVKDIKSKFKILNIFEIEWSRTYFSNNLTRFYGQSLPKNSHKEKHCGTDKFLLVIVEDLNPNYKRRMTSRGKEELVNVNMFDAKHLYRNWTGGGHKIHATDSEIETRHNIALLLGKTLGEYKNKKEFTEVKKVIKRDLTGYNGWKSLEELFKILNETTNYVVLRNFESYPKEFDFSIHGDIDILVENYLNTCFLINGKKKYNKNYRVAYEVLIANEMIDFDIRYKGDKYYCENFEKDILLTKELDKGFYKPSNDLLLYSLIYHAFIHKPRVIKDYKEKIIKLHNVIFEKKLQNYNEEYFKKILFEYLNKKEYEITDPVDISVYLNKKYFPYNEMRIERKFKEKWIKIKKVIKKIIRYKNEK